MTHPLSARSSEHGDDDGPCPEAPRATSAAGDPDGPLRAVHWHGSLYRLRDDAGARDRVLTVVPDLPPPRSRGWRRALRRLFGRDPHRRLPDSR